MMLREVDSILPDTINRLLQASADISGNPDFGLCMAEWVEVSMYGLLGYMLLNCGTVKNLFETLVRYHTVHHNAGITYKMVFQKNTVSLQIYHDERTLTDHRHTTEWCLGFIPFHLKSPLGKLATPLKVQFMHAAPENLNRLQAYFGHNLEFNQAHDQLIYPASILDEHITDTNSNMLNTLRNAADDFLLSLKQDNSLLKTIRAILFEKLGSGENNASDIAGALNMSLSTFKRRLIEEGIDFKRTKESIKNELARELLSHPSIKMYEIAQKTGFTNQSSFTRFFRRCNRQTPQDYRKSRMS
jgi:AraC-like DNA-binding protein